MYKIVYNNIIIDVMKKLRYVRYLTKSDRFVGTDRLAATGILASDGDEVYHLEGKPYNFPSKVKTVRIEQIEQEEFDRLTSQLVAQEKALIPSKELQSQIDALAAMVSQLSAQNQTLLQQIEEINRGEG